MMISLGYYVNQWVGLRASDLQERKSNIGQDLFGKLLRLEADQQIISPKARDHGSIQ